MSLFIKKIALLLLIILSLPVSTFSQWFHQNSGTSKDLLGISFADTLNGWVCGKEGTILHTSNQGLNWNNQISGTSKTLFDITFTSATNGWVVGDSGTVLVTYDGGINWEARILPNPKLFRKVKFIDSLHGMIAGDMMRLYYTHDGGVNWNQLEFNYTMNIPSLSYLSLHIFAFCIDSSAIPGIKLVHRTFDNGITYMFPYTSPLVYELTYAVNQGMYMLFGACEKGRMKLGYFLGDEWRDANVEGADSSINFYSLHANDLTYPFWAVGSKGKIIKSVDSGLTWLSVPSEVTVNLYDIAFPSQYYGWAVGDSGTIITYRLITNIEDNNIQISDYDILKAYPNPFNGSVNIQYELLKNEVVSLKIYNELGQQVTELISEYQNKGKHSTSWNTENNRGTISSGVYYIYLKSGNYTSVKKIINLK